VGEGLSRAILDEKIKGLFISINMGGSYYLSHIFFMETILVLYDGLRRELETLKRILELYSKATRMRINEGQYTIYVGYVLYYLHE
jgi:hypothetical protein